MSRARGWLWPVAVAGLVVAAWLTATLASVQITSLPMNLRSPSGAPGPSRSPTPTRSYDARLRQGTVADPAPGWLTELIAIVCLLGALVAVGVLVAMLMGSWTGRQRPLRRDPADPPAIAPSAEEVVAALDAGLAALTDADTDPRRAVIACWVRLEQAAASAGTPRRAADSPTDLVRRLLDAHRVSRAVLDRFAAVYREARYATHAVDERMRETAVSALRQLRGELTADRAADVGPTGGGRGDHDG